MPEDLVTLLTSARLRVVSLRKAIESGVSRVTQGDRTVEYRSGSEMTAALLAAEREVRRLEELLGLRGPMRVARTVVFIGSKGI